MTENRATPFVEDNGYHMRVFRYCLDHDDVTKNQISEAPWPLQNECWKKDKRISVTRNISTKWTFVLYMDMCTPNMIDIGSNFSINQGSLVFDLGPVFL